MMCKVSPRGDRNGEVKKYHCLPNSQCYYYVCFLKLNLHHNDSRDSPISQPLCRCKGTRPLCRDTQLMAPLLQGINFDINEGENIRDIMGPSGSGKNDLVSAR